MTEPKNPRWKALDTILEKSRVKVDGPVIKFSSRHSLSIAERVQADAVLEYWVQQYVRSNSDRLGLKGLEGPFETGPDFRAMVRGYKGKVEIEVEVRSENYLHHGHPDDARWNNVKVLIILQETEPDEAVRRKLPKKIIHIDKEHFTGWYREAAKEWALRKEKQDPLNRNLARLCLIAGRIHHNWLEVCPHKERDMATCPECDLCPYFGAGVTGDATSAFENYALEFLRQRDTPENLDIGNIAEEEVNAFCRKVFGY